MATLWYAERTQNFTKNENAVNGDNGTAKWSFNGRSDAILLEIKWPFCAVSCQVSTICDGALK